MTEKGWHRAFDDPIPLPGGGELRILHDAGNYITKLPSTSTTRSDNARLYRR
jgi:hypothetical protein